MDDRRSVHYSIVVPELYFLITKFLSAGPLQETAKVLIQELEKEKVLPKRIDWLGKEHDQSFTELERKYSHIGPQHLLEICCRIGPILDKEIAPSVPGIISLLGSGRQNLLRTKESVCRPRSLVDYCTKLHGMPIPDSANSRPNHNLLKVLIGRELAGPISRKLLIPTSFYSKTCLLRRTLGHLSAVYCVLFDRSGRYIVTGADDLLVKLWSAVDGRLLITFRGASAEITDIAINLDNTLLAAGSLDRILRVWDLQTAAPIAVLPGHTGMITSVNFCPSPRGDLKYLVTTSTDGSVAFWQYTTPRGAKTVFAPKPIQYHEKLRPGQAQMICASFSPGGIFLAAGSADHHVRVYIMSEDGPKRILETEAHSDAVDSIQWAHRGIRFVSGSKDGTALVWSFESQQWKSLKLNMTQRLASCPEPEEGKKIKVTMVAWDYSDKYVVTAVNDFTIKIWESRTGTLHKVLRGHRDELYVLESHPKDEHVLLSAGHDGQLFLWDIEAGVSVAHFVNCIDGQGQGGVFDAKWSPDGTMIAATDSHGHILMFGFGAGHERFKTLPRELFFHTDYRPLLRDANHMVMDEQTQMMPHLMPPPFLVDVDGNPHPPIFQRLVPGRENCPSEQLVPNIAVGPEGVEVIDGNASVSHLDRLIEALANRQGQDQAPDSNNDRDGNGIGGNAFGQNNNNNNFGVGGYRLNQSPRSNASNNSNNLNGHRGVGLRRSGDVEGVRQSSGNWQRDTPGYKWIRRIYVKPMRYAALQTLKQTVFAAGQEEHDIYRREMRRRPIMINTATANTALKNSSSLSRRGRGTRTARRGPRPAYRTRAVREREPVIEEVIPEDDEEEESISNSSGDSSDTGVNEDMLSGSSSSEEESSDYSDWVADKPGPNLEPPKRSKRKPVERRNMSPSSDASQPGSSRQRGRKKIPIPSENGEIPEVFKPPEWLSEVIPRKAPYYPQMGDEVYYFRQGHQRYLEAVRLKKVYKLTNSSEPWRTLELRDHELVRVIGIKYEIRPPRLCCLKLALINEDGRMTGKTFTIKYHDMPDVLDFLVLRQTFETAVARNWGPGDRFRCMIDDAWWMGEIESRLALSPEFPDSYFMCYKVRWDTDEYEYMSPWDLEPIDENRLPVEVGAAVPVLPEELRTLLYQPKAEEWPRGDRDASCRRIISGLEQVMGLAIADPFLAPVDLNAYPTYAYVVEYPIDLTTIKARFENHFYRRITSAQFDVRYLATNAEKFNQSHSTIVKQARIITDLCLRIIREPNDIDVGAVYHQLVATYISSDSENENDSNHAGPSTSTGGPTTSSATKKSVNRKTKKHLRADSGDWRVNCRELLELLWQCDDSSPFREPVDTLEHPDYLQIVDTPMDLRTVKEDLLGGNYASPLEFAKDVRLIFQNSRNYNTNKKSRIFAMTIRLSTLFEEHIKQVIYNWKAARRRAEKDKKTKGSPQDRNKPGPSNRPGPSTRATNGNVRSKPSPGTDDTSESSDGDNDDDEIVEKKKPRGGRIRGRNGGRVSKKGITNGGITSTAEPVAGPSGGGRGRNLRRNISSRPNSQEEEDDDNEENNGRDNDDNTPLESTTNSSSSGSSASSSSSEDDDSDESRGIAVQDLGTGTKMRKRNGRNRDDDSEDSYKPNERRTLGKKRGRKRKNLSRNKKEIGNNLKRSKLSTTPSDEKETKKSAVNSRRGNYGRKKKEDRNSSNDDDEHYDNLGTDGIESNNSDDIISNKPKRGRPPSSAARARTTTTSTAAASTSEHTQPTPPPSSRRTRQNTEESERNSPEDIHSGTRLRTNRRMLHLDTDHSYHIQTVPSHRTSSRRILQVVDESESEHDSNIQQPRHMRTRPRRRLHSERDSGNDNEDGNDDSQQSNKNISSSKLTQQLKKTESSENSLGESSNMVASSTNTRPVRQIRTNRNSRVPLEETDENDDDDDDDNEPLANHINANSTQLQRSRITRTLNEHQSQNGGPLTRINREQNQVNSAYVISRRAAATQSSSASPTTITTSRSSHSIVINSDSVPSSSTTQLRGHVFRSHVQVDHNYGEPGPSTLRNTRRMLSRHQRNADELDLPNSSANSNTHENSIHQLPNVVENISSRLRMRQTVNSTTVTRNGIEIPERQIRQASLRSNNNNNNNNNSNNRIIEEENEDVDVDIDVGVEQHHDNSSEDSDSDDNAPLTSYVRHLSTTATAAASSSTTVIKNRTTNSDRIRQQRTTTVGAATTHHPSVVGRTLRKRNFTSDEDYEGEGYIDDYVAYGRNSRSTRNLKRPRYNEDTDDDSLDDERKRRATTAAAATTTTATNNSHNNMRLASSPNYRQRTTNVPSTSTTTASATNRNLIDDDYVDSDNEQNAEQVISISSRGRIRKITAKARGLFRD